jgi:multiple antibiotic resistance protein
MGELLPFALITLAAILFIVDPLAALPAYLVVTQHETPDARRRTARRACIAVAALLVAFAAVGGFIFRLLGITLAGFRIAGGVILWFVALDMLQARRATHESGEELEEGQVKEDVAFTPLAMPILAGPGAISTAMVLAGRAESWAQTVVVYGAILATALASYVTLVLGERLLAVLGRTGIRVLTRIMGLLLAAVATEFILTGLRESLFP